ncbi:hypothetical protein D3C72_1116340 [compost metagenome]
MKAVLVRNHGGPKVLKYEDIEIRQPGPGISQLPAPLWLLHKLQLSIESYRTNGHQAPRRKGVALRHVSDLNGASCEA